MLALERVLRWTEHDMPCDMLTQEQLEPHRALEADYVDVVEGKVPAWQGRRKGQYADLQVRRTWDGFMEYSSSTKRIRKSKHAAKVTSSVKRDVYMQTAAYLTQKGSDPDLRSRPDRPVTTDEAVFGTVYVGPSAEGAAACKWKLAGHGQGVRWKRVCVESGCVSIRGGKLRCRHHARNLGQGGEEERVEEERVEEGRVEEEVVEDGELVVDDVVEEERVEEEVVEEERVEEGRRRRPFTDDSDSEERADRAGEEHRVLLPAEESDHDSDYSDNSRRLSWSSWTAGSESEGEGEVGGCSD